jgi:hypothetical protein
MYHHRHSFVPFFFFFLTLNHLDGSRSEKHYATVEGKVYVLLILQLVRPTVYLESVLTREFSVHC